MELHASRVESVKPMDYDQWCTGRACAAVGDNATGVVTTYCIRVQDAW